MVTVLFALIPSTKGIIISDIIIANEPALGAALTVRINEPGAPFDSAGNIITHKSITEIPVIIAAQAPSFEAFLLHKPYKNGAIKQPEIAPQDNDIRVTMALGFVIDIINEAATNMIHIVRIKFISTFLDMFLLTMPLPRSMVIADPETKTNEAKVDIEAESTSTVIRPRKISGIADCVNISGTILS